MSHLLEMKEGRASFAFTGDRNNIWHRLGQQIEEGQSLETWAKAAGLDFRVILTAAFAELAGDNFAHLPENQRKRLRGYFKVRTDNGQPLGYVSERYQPVQPADVLEWFERYIRGDSRFKLSAAGVLKQGERVWATAEYCEPVMVGGSDAHKAYLLMTTTFDGSGATINQASLIRAVCNNTITAAMVDGSAVVRTRHSTKFDADKVARELAKVVESVAKYKAMGDAMLATEMRKDAISKYFKTLLEIPFDAKEEDISSRKLGQFEALGASYRATVGEGTPAETQWAALNAVTRWVDHDRHTRGGSLVTSDEARMLSVNFGSGAQLKAKAISLLQAA